MISGWLIFALAIAYVGGLFALAAYGDRAADSVRSDRARPTVYALSMAVFCTSWTFFGSVGIASTTGLQFLAVYCGAMVMVGFGAPLMQRVADISKSQNITSIADFIGARYGKSQVIAAIVTVIAVIATLPYIALQLKAIALAVSTLTTPPGEIVRPADDTAFVVTAVLAVFSILFGTRHIDATEHQDGLMLAVATESAFKLVTFLIIGLFVTFMMFDGPGDLWSRALERDEIADIFSQSLSGTWWLTVTFLSFVCIVLMPRQFHVAIVENRSPAELRRARWLFPTYLVLINVFVVPIAVAGLLVFPAGTVNADMFVLALPLAAGADGLALLAFLGGLSAATAMVVVASVALAIMVCNDIIVPVMLRRSILAEASTATLEDVGPQLLQIRRLVIVAVLLSSYGTYTAFTSGQNLAAIGTLSFAATAQFAPAFFGGLFWSSATARGAIAGLCTGFATWIYTMLVPWFADSLGLFGPLVADGPFGLAWLRPEAIFGLELDRISHGVFWSMLLNTSAFIIVSRMQEPRPIERMQAAVFVQNELTVPLNTSARLWDSNITMGDLMSTTGRYLGEARTRRAFEEHARGRSTTLDDSTEADITALRFTERLLASAIGAASSRLVLSLLMRRNSMDSRTAIRLLDDASEAIQYNRDLLQSALDQVSQGIGVFDVDGRLICWNRQFLKLLSLPSDMSRVGIPLDHVLTRVAENGDFGAGPVDEIVADRLHRLIITRETFYERLDNGRRVLEIRTSPMPQGGTVTTFTDITDRVEAADALKRANETLERRVADRTSELTQVNDELAQAKARADAANFDKTRFLAAAGHDILQPLNAARLYTTSLVDSSSGTADADLARNIDASLEAVEEILGALLDISRLDTGALTPEWTEFCLDDLFRRLTVEFQPIAEERGLELRILPSTLWVRSDRRLMRRVLQNLVGNAIKYTTSGRVVMGCRQSTDGVRIEVWDTGPGIPNAQQEVIFEEFHRLESAPRTVRGLGLGLSIVQRIGRVLDHPISVTSEPGRGSMFAVTLPRTAPAKTPIVTEVKRSALNRTLGLTVLCIDNEPAIVESMTLVLTNWGCQVVPAAGAAAALAQLRAQNVTPDIILADYHLDEGATGVGAVMELRAALDQPIPGIIITADRTTEIEREVKQADLAILRKPLKPASLRALMGQITLSKTTPSAAE